MGLPCGVLSLDISKGFALAPTMKIETYRVVSLRSTARTTKPQFSFAVTTPFSQRNTINVDVDTSNLYKSI